MKKLWIGTSWKMNKTLYEALGFAEGLLAAETVPQIQRFVIPPFTCIREVKQKLAHTDIKVGAQNMHWEDRGAWTGEVSPVMLADCQLDIVELGHSERREYFGETNKTVGLKTAAAIRHGLVPLICIGETLEQKQAGMAEDILREQVEGALAELDAAQKKLPMLFAYEPVWAIGENGIPASAGYANHQQQLIKQTAQNIRGESTLCLYGGSVNSDNCEELVQCDSIDGLFIGRSAWEVSGYLRILEKCSAYL